MSLGLSGKFQILQQSPYDFQPLDPEQAPDPGAFKWIPSRYNIRATTPDQRLVLWNSYKGTMTVFDGAQRPVIEALLSRKGFEARKEGIVEYLFKRGFLVKEGTDEFRRIQLGFGQQQYRTDVLQLILLASEDCNFRCQYCYEDFARSTMQPAVHRGIRNLLQKRLPTLRSLAVSWFGGEPLYGFPAIEDLAPFFLATAEEHGLHYSTHMTTNGYLLTPEIAEKLLAWKIDQFQITIDGAAEDHNRSRPGRGGEETFAVILENLQALSRRPDRFFVDVRVNFDRRNRARLGELLDVMEAHFRDDSRFKLRFRAVGQWGGAGDDQLDVCGHDEAEDVVRRMKAEASKRGIGLSDDIRHVQGLGAQVCYAARPYNFIVGASGKLMKCTIDLDKQDRNVVGHLSEEGDMDLDLDKLALWTEPAFEQDTKCQKCVVLPACQGVFCPQIRMDTGHSPCSPLRMGAKAELLETVAASHQTARPVTVPGTAARPSDSSVLE